MESQTHLGRKIPLMPSNPTANPALPKPLLNPAQGRAKCSGHKQTNSMGCLCNTTRKINVAKSGCIPFQKAGASPFILLFVIKR